MGVDWWLAKLTGTDAQSTRPNDQQGYPSVPHSSLPPAVVHQAAQRPTLHHRPNGASPVTEAMLREQLAAGVISAAEFAAAAAAARGGGQGARLENELCPQCGSSHYFTRRSFKSRGMSPAPYCHTCGYNGMFEQYGNSDHGEQPLGELSGI